MKLSFDDWVTNNGGEMLTPTSQFEVHRFRAWKFTHVICNGKGGLSFSGPEASAIYDSYKRGESVALAQPNKRYKKKAHDMAALISRDGPNCWFCLMPFHEDDPPTLEHLVARSKGGQNHLHNYVRAHQSCNTDADDKSVADKCEIRIRNLRLTNG